MSRTVARWPALIRWGLAATMVAALCPVLLVTPSPLSAQVTNPVYTRIEEDWMLTVLDPDAGRAAPQVGTQMAPSPTSEYFCNFKLNYRELSAFVTGGLQVQIWKGDVNKKYKSFGTNTLAVNGEIVTWTQYMKRNEDSHRLKFGITQGNSVTWGNLALANLSVTAKHYDEGEEEIALDDYDPVYSVENSGITYGANRVSSLQIVQVRKYRADGSADVDSTVRTIFQAAP